MFESRIPIKDIVEQDSVIDLEECQKHQRFSPLIAPVEEIAADAIEIADFIDNTQRKSISFNRYLAEHDIDYVPECVTNPDMLLDTGSGSGQTGKATFKTYQGILETKKICAECPLKKLCLAVSMTEARRTRTSKNEVSIPGTDETTPIVMSEYLIFGGYTPQEREIMYEMICHILQERDDLYG